MTAARIAIVEDDEAAAKTLRGYIERYGAEKDKSFVLKTFTCASTVLAEYRNDYDIIFMDVELPDGNGIDVIKRLREEFGMRDAIVIFVTKMAQYAVKGYEVRALDYIVKPVTYGNFEVKLSVAIEAFAAKQNSHIWISNKTGKMRLGTRDIYYIEVFQHMLVYHTTSGNYKATGSIASAAEQLNGKNFSLCNRCFLVNLRYVTSVTGVNVEVNGEKLQISDRRRAAFMRDLNNFIASGGGGIN